MIFYQDNSILINGGAPMLSIHTLPLGDYQTNCYIVHSQGAAKCCILDPGYEADTIRSALRRLNLTPAAILLTHGHFDHVGAVRELAEAFGSPVYIGAADLRLPAIITNGPLYYTHIYPPEGALSLAGLDIRILPTPGHTPGSVCLLVGDALFSGDTLFAGACGRTDLPGGSWGDMHASLEALAHLQENCQVYPGHGPATTLEQEKLSNPYLLACLKKRHETDTDRS